MDNKFKKKELIFGFGHRVYKKGDPRSPIFKKFAKELAKYDNTGMKEAFAIAEYCEGEVMR